MDPKPHRERPFEKNYNREKKKQQQCRKFRQSIDLLEEEKTEEIKLMRK